MDKDAAGKAPADKVPADKVRKAVDDHWADAETMDRFSAFSKISVVSSFGNLRKH